MNEIQSRMMHHLRVLSQEIGPRPVGSTGNRKAADYIDSVFKEAGLDVEIQPFSVPDWTSKGSTLNINGEEWRVRANPFSPPCNLSAEIVSFCTIEQLEASSQLTGKIALLYGELTKENWVPKGFTIYNPEHHRKIISLLEQKRPSALITVCMQTESDLPIVNDWDFDIPSVTVSPEMGLLLLEKGLSAPVHINIDSTRKEGLTCNVIGKWRGNREEIIVFTAHYDTVFGTNGAFDNASGVSMLLTLAEQIAHQARQRRYETGFEFIAFSSEEYLGLGDQHYVKRRSGNFEQVLAALNFDGIGQAVGTNHVTLMAGSDPLLHQLKAMKGRYESIQWTDPWYESNHYTFFSRGVPSIPFSCTGVKHLLHTKEDRFEWISAEKCWEVFQIAMDIIDMLQDKSPEWTRNIPHASV